MHVGGLQRHMARRPSIYTAAALGYACTVQSRATAELVAAPHGNAHIYGLVMDSHHASDGFADLVEIGHSSRSVTVGVWLLK